MYGRNRHPIDETQSRVSAVTTNSFNPTHSKNSIEHMSSKMDKLEKEMSLISTKLELLMVQRQSPRGRMGRSPSPSYGYRRESVSPNRSVSPSRNRSEMSCFKCRGKGHFARDCPSKEGEAKRVSFNESENGKGSDNLA